MLSLSPTSSGFHAPAFFFPTSCLCPANVAHSLDSVCSRSYSSLLAK